MKRTYVGLYGWNHAMLRFDSTEPDEAVLTVTVMPTSGGTNMPVQLSTTTTKTLAIAEAMDALATMVVSRIERGDPVAEQDQRLSDLVAWIETGNGPIPQEVRDDVASLDWPV